MALHRNGDVPDMELVDGSLITDTEAHTAQGQDHKLTLQIKALKAANKVINHSLFRIHAKQNFAYSSSPACSDLLTDAMTSAVRIH